MEMDKFSCRKKKKTWKKYESNDKIISFSVLFSPNNREEIKTGVHFKI